MTFDDDALETGEEKAKADGKWWLQQAPEGGTRDYTILRRRTRPALNGSARGVGPSRTETGLEPEMFERTSSEACPWEVARASPEPSGTIFDVYADRILAFRLARSGLAVRENLGLAEAAACPASDFSRDAALLALAARTQEPSRDAYARAVDAGGLVVAHAPRGAIHALAPGDFALYGRALIARDDNELAAQLGQQVKRLAAEKGFAPSEVLEEVASATENALATGRALDKNELHDELRKCVRAEVMPWCRGCQSYHVAPMLWRYATVKAGVRLDSQRRYTWGEPGTEPAASGAVRRFLAFYGPAKPGDFAEWAGLAKSHAQRLWDETAGDLVEVGEGKKGWLLREDLAALESPPAAEGIRLLPPGDPYLQKPNRPLLAPDPELRKRLFRPVASPGAVLSNGRLAGLWRIKAKGRKAEITVEKLGSLPPRELEAEAQYVAALRGAADVALVMA